MSLELRDLRVKLTVEGHAWLEARSRESGDEMSHILRDLLHQKAISEMRVATVMDQLLRREGLPGIAGVAPCSSGKPER